MTAERNLRHLQLQLMPLRNDSVNTEACGKVKPQHMDHIADKGCVGSCHHGLEHKPVSVQEATKIPEAKSMVDKE